MNSREKGKRGERQWRDELRANGYAARRGQQFAGGHESPDVVCDELPWLHFEVKAVERLRIHEAMDQACRDCQTDPTPHPGPMASQARHKMDAPGLEIASRSVVPDRGGEGVNVRARKVPIVVHKRKFRLWLVTMEAETFFRFMRGELPPGNGTNGTDGGSGGEGSERATSNIQHSTSNIERGKGDGKARGAGSGGTSNIQHPTSNIE